MATSSTGLAQGDAVAKPGTPLTWTLSILACAYFLWTGSALFFSTRVFANMFASMGVELPPLTSAVVGTYRFLYPVLFGGASILVIVKQFYMREKWANISVTLAATVVLNIISNGIVNALYRPLLDLMEKLNK
jgi:hypothetical protein